MSTVLSFLHLQFALCCCKWSHINIVLSDCCCNHKRIRCSCFSVMSVDIVYKYSPTIYCYPQKDRFLSETGFLLNDNNLQTFSSSATNIGSMGRYYRQKTAASAPGLPVVSWTQVSACAWINYVQMTQRTGIRALSRDRLKKSGQINIGQMTIGLFSVTFFSIMLLDVMCDVKLMTAFGLFHKCMNE